jgi:hypothetical protein
MVVSRTGWKRDPRDSEHAGQGAMGSHYKCRESTILAKPLVVFRCYGATTT